MSEEFIKISLELCTFHQAFPQAVDELQGEDPLKCSLFVPLYSGRLDA